MVAVMIANGGAEHSMEYDTVSVEYADLRGSRGPTFITPVGNTSKRILPEIEKGDGKAMGWAEAR